MESGSSIPAKGTRTKSRPFTCTWALTVERPQSGDSLQTMHISPETLSPVIHLPVIHKFQRLWHSSGKQMMHISQNVTSYTLIGNNNLTPSGIPGIYHPCRIRDHGLYFS